MKFTILLQRAIEEQGMTNRGLGRAVNPEDPDAGYVQVKRHLRGKFYPTPATRASYCKALGLHDGALDVDLVAVDVPDAVPIEDRLAAIVKEIRAIQRDLKASA